MSDTEILVIIFGLFIGYWIASKLIGSEKTKNEQSKTQSVPDPESQHHQEQVKLEEQEQKWK